MSYSTHSQPCYSCGADPFAECDPNCSENEPQPKEKEIMGMDQNVTIDHGDLSELQQAAEAWAGYLRKVRIPETQAALGALPAGVEDVTRYEAAADRIDQAISRSRRDAFDSVKLKA